MSSTNDWIVSSFTREAARGTIRLRESGDERAFAIEVWVPCDPATARRLQDNDLHRDELLPSVGEVVEVEWKRNRLGLEVPARVVRRAPLSLLPRLPFQSWLRRLGAHVEAVCEWDEGTWNLVCQSLDEDFEDTVFSEAPEAPERNLELLVWVKKNAAPDVVERRLAWLDDARHPAAEAVETVHGVVYVVLPSGTVARLVADGLMRRHRDANPRP